MEFDTFISRTKATYSDVRATQNLGKLNGEFYVVYPRVRDGGNRDELILSYNI